MAKPSRDVQQREGVAKPGGDVQQASLEALEAGGDDDAWIHPQRVDRADEGEAHLATVRVPGQNQIRAEIARLKCQVRLVDERQARFVGRRPSIAASMSAWPAQAESQPRSTDSCPCP